MKRIFNISLISLGMLFATSCELDLQQSPNVLAPEQANLDFLSAGIQLELRNIYNAASGFGEDVMRMRNMFGSTYENAYTATSFDGIWNNSYGDLLIDAQVLIPVAKEQEWFHHAAIAEFARAYTLVTLVDFFGDVPLSEALDPNNFSPNVDGGASVYAAALTALDSAEANFNKTPLKALDGTNDLYYSGDTDNWIKAINTMRLKIYIQTRKVQNNVAAIQALITEDNFIDDIDEAFTFEYSTNALAPDARQPDFANNYVGGASDYMSNYLMDMMYFGKAAPDPRMRYYFYRQQLTIPSNPQLLPCVNRAAPPHYPFGTAFCFVGDGYWGRDHLDDDGIPPDTELRTIWGVYPAGGQFDADQGVLGQPGSGLQGAGIEPILMPAFTHFMLAEFYNVQGDAVNAATQLDAGIQASMDFVLDFGDALAAGTGFESDATDIGAYIAEVGAEFDAAGSAANQLEIIVREYFIASFANGIEMYNTGRRTGFPSDLQPALISNPGNFYNSFTYPAAFANRNDNVDQKPNNSVRVFWDDGSVSLN